jgi:hypothetical protein
MSGTNRTTAPRLLRFASAADGVRGDSETAAALAAVEQFLVDTAPAPVAEPTQSPWQRAALEDGIAARQVSGAAWGHAPR